MDLFAVFCPDGTLKLKDMNRCQAEKWIPIATITVKNKINALIFSDVKVARNFIRRNYPKDWLRGLIVLSTKQLEWMRDKNWEVRYMTYPNILKDTPGFGYEVIEFDVEPDLCIRG